MPKPEPWTPDFMRHMIAKGSLIPPPYEGYTSRWYWPTVVFAVLVSMSVAIWWGVYGL